MSTIVTQVIQNNLRNVIIRATLESDGTNNETFTIFDATSAGAFGVTAPGGQVFYPGVNVKFTRLDYDVQDMKLALRWAASVDQDILALGSAPEDFNWERFGGLTVPKTLAGATGSIKAVCLNPVVGATFAIVMSLRKGVPQS